VEFCKKKQAKVESCYFENYESGDTYSYLDIKRNSGLFVAFSVGKWVQNVCNEMYQLVASRTQQPTSKNKIVFCSDGNDQNNNALAKFFNKDCVAYGQVIKAKDDNGKIIGRFTRKKIGNLSHDQIAINNIDGFCSYLRARIGCFVRKTRNFAKKRKQIISLLHVTQTNHNFVETKQGVTPAMLEGLQRKPLTWNDIFNRKLSINN